MSWMYLAVAHAALRHVQDLFHGQEGAPPLRVGPARRARRPGERIARPQERRDQQPAARHACRVCAVCTPARALAGP